MAPAAAVARLAPDSAHPPPDLPSSAQHARHRRKARRNQATIPPPPPQPPMMPAPAVAAAAEAAADESADSQATSAVDAVTENLDRLRFGSHSSRADDDRDGRAEAPSIAGPAAVAVDPVCACAPQFHAPDCDPLSPDERTVATESSPRSSRKSTRNNNPRDDDPDAALATSSSTEAASSSSSSSQPACSCFAVQYTCARCKSSTATAVARSSSAPVPARCVKSAAAANGAHGAVIPSTRTSQPTAHSPTAAVTRDTSAAVSSDSSVAAGACSSAPSASPGDDDDDDVTVVPTLNLAALEQEVERKYHIDRIAEQRALQRNKEAVKAQQEHEDKARQQAQTQGQPPASPHQYHHTHPLTARGKPIFKWSEIRTHASAESCWLVVRGTVYDVTPMLSTHPAGIQSILRNGGTEASSHFDFHSKAAAKLWSKYEIGVLEGHTTPSCAIQ